MIEEQSRRHLAYYITAHGYGHGVRSCDILRAFHELEPTCALTICSGLPLDFLRSRLPGVVFDYREVQLDSGMVQIDSVRVDLAASLSRIQSITASWDALVKEEEEWLQAAQVSLVVADIPAIPLQAAARLGIPSVGISNFTWSWIYEDFVDEMPAWGPIIDRFKEGYAAADLCLRLPFSESMDAFSQVEEVGVVSRPGESRREQIAENAGADPRKTWVLLSFTTLEWSEEALNRVSKLEAYEFFTLRPLAWEGPRLYALDRNQFTVQDIFASVDAVLSKPGFGVLSECLANKKPLIYVERENFREYPVLEAAIQKFLRHVHLPAADLYAGKLEAALECLSQLAPPLENLPLGGDRICALRLREMLPPRANH